ncbi:hypothetical protein LOAG_17674 [Loa loa]|uniref:Uncharacterized protein n=1 Tax=Loa loa TaxID=7209 RepID=A0A1S0UJY6_LOALO|nr:hypothetical protein LOAG_17674 [Loa loa]EJD75114.1 hypothetical protein LOAG_17674 [Loa loa]
MVSSFVILLMLIIFTEVNSRPASKSTMESRLIQRNFYWYTKGKEERLQNKLAPFGFDHLPPQTVLCVASKKKHIPLVSSSNR